ncbi:pitrilysin family protein [Aestuariivita sp.]|jgi:zinc protease|uniref:M16 family metallopeptidase n=1 Tax=Aestuariivita sp. TaxID=1872407 RepID=UPI002173432E|nr:pitrilysin family protein [Aestuariivita sp.]MCE8007251.1 insulinase family protein [Aestuariivita sp.]
MTRIFAALVSLCLAAPAWADVTIKEVTSPGGVDAWLVEDHSIPFMALELRFRGGTSLDADDARGATNLMVGLLEEGAGELDARAFARELEGLAASISFDSSDDDVSVSARFLSENREDAVRLLKLALTQPRFDEDAVERVRQQVLSGLRSDARDPNKLAGEAFAAMAYGTHPYARPEQGTITSVSALTREDLIDAHLRTIARDRLFIGAVGDITEEELGTLLDDLLSAIPETGASFPDPAEVTIDGGVTVVPFDTPQSVALFGHRGIDRDDPDFFPAFVMNHILGGGGFESRLMTEVREKRGLTYGVYSYLLPKDLAAVYLGSVASANDRMAEAIDVIRAEWARMAEAGVTAEELDAAKTYLTGAYPLRFDGHGRIASIMTGMQLQGLGVDYITTRNAKVEAVTVEDIARVAARVMQPDNLHFVVVGQPEGLDVATE